MHFRRLLGKEYLFESLAKDRSNPTVVSRSAKGFPTLQITKPIFKFSV